MPLVWFPAIVDHGTSTYTLFLPASHTRQSTGVLVGKALSPYRIHFSMILSVCQHKKQIILIGSYLD